MPGAFRRLQAWRVPPSPAAAERIVTRLLLPRADGDAGAGLIISPIVITFFVFFTSCATKPSLEAGHSVRDQVLKVERYPVYFEGLAGGQLSRNRERARHSAIGALEDSAFLSNVATGVPQVVRLVKSVQLRRRGTSVK